MKKISKNLIMTTLFAVLFGVVVGAGMQDEMFGMVAGSVSFLGGSAMSLQPFMEMGVFNTFSWVGTSGEFVKLDADAIMKLSKEDGPKYMKALHDYALAETAFVKELAENQQKTIDEFKETLKDYDTVKEEVIQLTLALKAISEDPQDINIKETNLTKFVKSEEVLNRLKTKSAGFNELQLKVEQLFAHTKAAAVMSVNGTALPSTANIIGADGYSTLVGNYVDQNLGMTPKPQNFILGLVNVITAPGTENIWWSERQNEEGDAQFIGEGDLKPLIDGEWITKKEDIKEVAEHWKMTNRLMKHAPSVVNNFRTHADELVEQKIDTEVLTGDGLGDNMTGIATAASAFIVPTQLALFYRDANIFDAICAVAVSVELANFTAEVVVLNTVWKARMKALKNTDGDYIMPPFVTPDGNEVAGLRVVFSNKVDDTKMLLGDLRKFNVVFAENIEFAEGFEDKDFTKNMTSFKLEAFLGSYLKSTDAGSIIYDDIATILTAIDDPLL